MSAEYTKWAQALPGKARETALNPNDYGWEGITKVLAEVKMREVNPHNGGLIKPEAVRLQGYRGVFNFAWHMDEDDPYPNEVAFMPDSDRQKYFGTWPDDAPGWIASGDLHLIKHLIWGVDYGENT